MATATPLSAFPRLVYSQLEDSDEIRLLSLQPRSSGATIRCTINHVKLSSKPRYEALSYMWGPKVRKPIEIDGRICNVRENLWSALSHLRFQDKRRTLWIDAICINQKDVGERNHQVTQMGLIYTKAERVIVWLGPSNPEASLAMKWLGKVHGLGQEDIDIEGLKAIKSLCFRDYWSRLWIIQEVILAPEIWIQCGFQASFWSGWKIEIRYTEDDRSADKRYLADEISGSLPGQFFNDRIERATKGRASSPLLELCSKYGDAKCEDIRDKVFGLHTLANTCCRDTVLVEYSLPWYQICGTVLHHHMREHTPKDPSYLINISQEFHGKMRMSDVVPPKRKELEPDAETVPESRYGKLYIEAVGYFRGHISSISPLSKSSTSEDTQLPIFSSSIVLQLRYIDSLREEYQSQNPSVTSQTDLVWSSKESSSYALRPRKVSFGDYLVSPFMDLWKGFGRRMSISSQELDVTNHFRQVLLDAKNTVLGTPSDNCSLALEESGLICFVPGDTQAGDLICQFIASDVLAIIREDPKIKGRYKVVGRAVNFLASFSTTPFDIFGRSLFWVEEHELRRVTFKLDIPTLQMMTRASATPDPASKIPDPLL